MNGICSILAIVITCLTAITVGQGQSYPLEGKSCQALGRGDITVQPYEVLDRRLPDSRQLNLTEGCMKKAQQQVERWRQEDLDHWEQLSNQLCSAKTGWVEYNPGTCQAGGPPPICPANHWYRDPQKAMAAFEVSRKTVAEQRNQSLMTGACDCLRSELENQVTTNTKKQDTSNPYNINTNPFVVPCFGNDSCPPGTLCKNGVCRTLTNAENTVQSATEFATAKAKDQVIDKWLEAFTEMAQIRIPAAISSLHGKIISPYALPLLEPTTISTNRDGYERALRSVGSDMSRLRRLYQELHNYYQRKPARAPSSISADIRREKGILRKNMESMNIFAMFVVKGKELSRYSCYNLFEFQNQLVNESIVNLLSLPEPEN